jgi:hypothetical protein
MGGKENLSVVQFCYCPHIAKQKTVNELVSDMISKKSSQSLPQFRHIMISWGWGGGIDTSDMMLYTCQDECQTVKYWKKICFNIFS